MIKSIAKAHKAHEVWNPPIAFGLKGSGSMHSANQLLVNIIWPYININKGTIRVEQCGPPKKMKQGNLLTIKLTKTSAENTEIILGCI